MIQKNYKFVRHFTTIFLGALLCAQVCAQHITKFLFSETVPDYLRKTMQTNAEAVFAEINNAYDRNNSKLTLSLSNVTVDANERIETIWAASHFYCTETSIITRVLKSSNGYQVRNIPVFFVQGEKPEDKYQDMVIEFTLDGKISDMYIAIALNQYVKIMSNSGDVTDLRNRQMIVEFIENFLTAYNRKDISFLEKIYGDDLLILTGNMLYPQKRGDVPETKFSNGEQYLANIKKVFEKNSYINIRFCEIIVTQHEDNPNIYGIKLKQEWNASDGFHDEGWLFLMIDYKDGNNPIIWVRTWQPLIDPNTGREIHYNTEDIFEFKDFPLDK